MKMKLWSNALSFHFLQKQFDQFFPLNSNSTNLTYNAKPLDSHPKTLQKGMKSKSFW